MRTAPALLGLLALMALTSAVSPEAAFAAPQSDEGQKLALIIAISDYGTPPNNPNTGEPMRRYRNLNAQNDVPLIRGVLEVQGFPDENIMVVQDSAADAEGIRAAFEQLVNEADEGDVIVFHYSGHGHRMTNDNPAEDEETDGYDELLVPHGAHDEFYDGYDGSGHIRDDEVGSFLAALRGKVGPQGNVTFFIDACHSGTFTRGSGDELAARGSQDPLGPPAGETGDVTDAGTGMEMGDLPGTRGSGDEGLAPYAVFSAAAQRQVAFETYDVDGKTRVGSLSYALARTIPNAAPGTTYRALFAEVTKALSGKVRQTPQVEGTIDAELFSNRLTPQRPYVEVSLVVPAEAGEPAMAALAGGSLMGLNAGTRLLVHDVGTSSPDAETAQAQLMVVESQPLEAIAEVVEGSLAEEDAGDWAFVTLRSFGDLATRVQLEPGLRDTDLQGLNRVLGDLGIVEFVEEGADVIITPGDGIITAYTASDSLELAQGAQDVVRVVENFARNQYLRRLDFQSEDIQAALDIAPTELERDRLRRVTGCEPADWEGAKSSPKSMGGGQWRMALGEAYHLRVTNTGERRAFIALLDLMPRGDIHVLRPRPDEAASNYELEPGATMDLGCFVLSDETGYETLKLFATAEPQDFRGMFETRGTRSGGSGDLSALEQIVSRSFSNTRSGEVGAPGGLATTVAVQIHVTEGR